MISTQLDHMTTMQTFMPTAVLMVPVLVDIRDQRVAGHYAALVRQDWDAALPALAKTEIKIATVAPNGSAWMRIFNKMKAKIKKKTKGEVVLRFLETPGHTPESMTVVVTDHSVSDRPRMALTGDTLFKGIVGGTRAPGRVNN